jgi:hypothetical protein
MPTTQTHPRNDDTDRPHSLSRSLNLTQLVFYFPVLPVIGLACCAALVTQFEPKVYRVLALALVPAGLAFGVMRWRRPGAGPSEDHAQAASGRATEDR